LRRTTRRQLLWRKALLHGQGQTLLNLSGRSRRFTEIEAIVEEHAGKVRRTTLAMLILLRDCLARVRT